MVYSQAKRPRAMTGDAAQGLAIEGLSFLAGQEELFLRFLALTGLTVGDLRQAAAEPAFLAGVLDFIMGHEKTLLEFAGAAGIDPASVGAARHALSPAYGDSA